MSEPTIVDVVRAVPPEADDVLNLVFAWQQADRDHWAGIQESWLVEAKAEAAAMAHGVRAALKRAEWGGTTRQYEDTLTAITDAVNTAQYPGPIRDWYIEQFTADQFFAGSHPAYGGGGKHA